MTIDSHPILHNILDHLVDVGFLDIKLTSQRHRAIFTFRDKINNHYVLKLKPKKYNCSLQLYIENFEITPSTSFHNSDFGRSSYSLSDAIKLWQGDAETDFTVMLLDFLTYGYGINLDFWAFACRGAHLIGLGKLQELVDNYSNDQSSYHWAKSSRGYPDIDACTYDILQNLFGSVGIAMSQSHEIRKKYSSKFVVNSDCPEDFIHPVQLHHPEFDHLQMLRIDGRLFVEDSGHFYTGIMEGETIKLTSFFQTV